MKDAPTGFVRLSGNVGTRISGLTLSAHVHGVFSIERVLCLIVEYMFGYLGVGEDRRQIL